MGLHIQAQVLLLAHAPKLNCAVLKRQNETDVSLDFKSLHLCPNWFNNVVADNEV
ncbi:hypothetical protein GA0061099_10336 [Bradyrhizobium yuanmingense]|uniref:Uncharacterized protein n=1 Tax=Bradyrhizobium yuanmingense TaxID=108015 RepID=A0A1C3XJL1_9BRAD|nr:hypothetical protein IQ15_07440 [Bradyrhizobium yuanmingense]SCB52453.1 hypothetical protein GA0061099_10336 [Bradyrhizobium yuanmingense]